jgi:kinesin family protein 20
MRNAAIEVEVREEVAQEMQDTLQRMQEDYAKRYQQQVSLLHHLFLARLTSIQIAASELKTDRKLDILSRTAITPAIARGDQEKGYLSSTPDIDRSMSVGQDESFTSALDRSDITESSLDEGGGRLSDVFTGNPIKSRMVIRDDSDDELDDVVSYQHHGNA